ncbi:MAG: MATE family efflux transporter [Candidatus Methanogranum gryphiswaldense]|nr:MAG: MATE family efflux transporter [Candidatus Methanogranum sp. U3.2.1]
MEETSRRTKDVNILTGDPKKAIIAMIIPISVALIIQTLNNVIDAVWVTGLGSDALAALGVVFPIFFILIAIGSGIGVGASQAIARRIGSKDVEGADKAAVQGMILVIICGVIMTVLMLLITPFLIGKIGGAGIEDECLAYIIPIIAGTVVIFLSSYFSSLLRSEGSAKRSMNIQIAGAAINIVLDPIFIYVFDWGLAGAALATIVAMGIPLLMCVYWYKIKKDTYLRLSFKKFKIDKIISKDILSVGLPAAMEMIMISVVAMLMNTIINDVGGTDSVAVYSSVWRIIDIATIPLMAMSWAIVPVCAASYGAKRYDRINIAYYYALKVMIVVMLALMVLIYVFAPQICILFSYSDNTIFLREDMVNTLRIMGLFLPFLALGFVSSGFFQSLGLGIKSLISTVIRNIFQVPVCLYLATFGVVTYMWWGVTISEILGSLIMGVWGITLLRTLMKNWKPPKDELIHME